VAATLGCPQGGDPDDWPRVLLLQTRGHPALVHAGLLQLQREGWPALAPENLLTPLTDLVREKDETRKLLGAVVRDAERELLYRLSIRGGPFRRDQALCIGAGDPPVSRTGDVFDGLVGPWIEPIGDEYYRLSPLLENAGSRAWDAKTVKRHQSSVGRAILRAGTLTSEEAAGVLMLGLAAKNGDLVAIVANGLLASPPAVRKAFGDQNPWLAHIYLEPQRAPFPHHELAGFLLRQLQFRIAADTEPAVAAKVAEAWNAEIVERTGRHLFLGFRLMYALQVLVRYQVELPASRALSLLCEIDAIHQEAPDLIPAPPPPLTNDPITILAVFLPARCTGFAFLSELLAALETTPAEVRARILAGLARSTVQLKFLFSRPWLREVDHAQPDWDSGRRVLGRAVALAHEWNAPTFGGCAAQALAIVLDEYVGNPEEALRVLADAEEVFGDLPDIGDQRATVYSHQKRHGDALRCWERVFVTWAKESPEEHDLAPMFAYRKAGVAAAELGDWRKARDCFLDGQRAAIRFNQGTPAAALLGDAAFAMWKAGDRTSAVRYLAQALRAIEAFPEHDASLAMVAARMLVGHIVVWAEREATGTDADLATPVPGMCSNPEPDPRILGAPRPPFALTWASLAHVAAVYSDVGICDEVQRRFGADDSPAVRFSLAILVIRRAFQTSHFDDLLGQAKRLAIAQDELVVIGKQGGVIWERPKPLDSSAGSENPVGFAYKALLTAALLALSTSGESMERAITAFQEASEQHGLHDEVGHHLDDAGQLLYRQWVGESVRVMKDASADEDRRMLAAVRVGTARDVSIEQQFYAHVLLFAHFESKSWRKEVAPHLAILVSREWEARALQPATLCAPRLTVPAIQAECRSTTEGMVRVARVLLAARRAVRVRMPDQLAQQLQRCAAFPG